MPTSPPMRALIFAAGRGERMRPLTDHTPKPLLQVKGRALIEWHLQALARAGVREVAINTAWLEECFEPALGDGSKWGLALHFSKEGRDHGGALETAGGMAKLLPWLTDNGRPAFWAVSADVYLPNFTFDPDAAARFTQSSAWAHLWMTANAPHHPHGDFGITPQGWATLDTEPRWTWTSIGLFKPVLIKGLSAGTVSPLRPWLNRAISQQRISAEIYAGPWTDVGTPERLAALETSAP